MFPVYVRHITDTLPHGILGCKPTPLEQRQCCLSWVDSPSFLKNSLKSHHRRDTVGSSFVSHFLLLYQFNETWW